jgi:hypothetical protein
MLRRNIDAVFQFYVIALGFGELTCGSIHATVPSLHLKQVAGAGLSQRLLRIGGDQDGY